MNKDKEIENQFTLENIIMEVEIMGLFGDKDVIVGAALGAGGAFDEDRETDKAAVFGAATHYNDSRKK